MRIIQGFQADEEESAPDVNREVKQAGENCEKMEGKIWKVLIEVSGHSPKFELFFVGDS